MATTAVAEVAFPGGLTSNFTLGPFKGKIVQVTGGSSANATVGTTAWAADDGISFPASAVGMRVVNFAFCLGQWMNSDQSLALSAAAEIAGTPTGSTVKVHSHGSNTSGSALQDITSDTYTVYMLLLGS